jgi:cytidine deaminase
MGLADLSSADRMLLDAARAVLDARACLGRHEVAAALRTRAGVIHTGLHVESSIGRASICAEGVAVLRTEDGGWRVVTPCGLCRELIGDYAPAARVIDYDAGRGDPVQVVAIQALLPGKTTRRWPGTTRE